MSKGLFFRMENVDAAGAGEDAEASLEVNANAAQAVEEVESASGDVTEVDTGIDNAEAAQEELADVQDLMEEAVEEGDGLSPREAAHVEARLEHVASLLGTTTAAMGLTFRKESFGGSASRLAATKMRLEGVKEWAAKIWEALKRGWQWLKEAVVNFFSKITGNIGAVEKRLKDLKGRVAAIEASAKQKNDKLKTGAKAFSVDGKTSKDTIVSVLTQAANIGGLMGKLAEESMPEKLNKDEGLGSKSTLEAIIKAALPAVASLPKGNPEGAVGYGHLLNGKTLIVAPEKKVAGDATLDLYKISVGDASDKTAEDYAALSKTDLGAVVETGIATAGHIASYQKVSKELISSIDNSIKYCEAQAKIIVGGATNVAEGDAAKKEAKDAGAKAAAIFGAVNSGVRAIVSKLPASAFSTVVAAADLVEANVTNFKAEEKAKA